MRALVTGAAGFIGSNLCFELERLGWEVVGLDDFSHSSFENLVGFRGDFVAADLERARDWGEAVGPVDVVFHQAAITDTVVSDQLRMMRANVEAFRVLLDWSAKRGVTRVVYASSAAVYGGGVLPMREDAPPSPKNVYGFSKAVMERVAADFAKVHPDIAVAGLRYFNVYGPGERFKGKSASMIWQLSRQILEGKNPRIFEFGEQYRDFIYVKDVVKANLKAAEKKATGVFNVCTGEKATFNELIAHLNASLGADLRPEYFKNPYSFYQEETLGDPSKSARQMSFRAEYTVAKGIEDYVGGLRQPRAARR